MNEIFCHLELGFEAGSTITRTREALMPGSRILLPSFWADQWEISGAMEQLAIAARPEDCQELLWPGWMLTSVRVPPSGTKQRLTRWHGTMGRQCSVNRKCSFRPPVRTLDDLHQATNDLHQLSLVWPALNGTTVG